MGYDSFLRRPKMEEQQVPDEDSNPTKLDGSINKDEVDVMDDLEHILGIDDDEDDDEIYLPKINNNINYGTGHQLSWGFNNWDDQFSYNYGEDLEEEEEEEDIKEHKCFYEENKYYNKVIKKESVGFCDADEDELKVSHLKLNLNYQEVLDAWSNRGSLWADDYSLSASTCGYYMGEVPVLMEEERTRRKASVMRYKEKRQNRLFSKKIRYHVRKLNADKRPRLKGRFVKRVS